MGQLQQVKEESHHPTPSLIQVHLVSQHHEWEVFWVRWASLHVGTFVITHDVKAADAPWHSVAGLSAISVAIADWHCHNMIQIPVNTACMGRMQGYQVIHCK